MRLIDADSYCENICRCNKERCDKGKCPIHNAPTVEAVPVVHGEWIKEENTWVCSVCRKENACAYSEELERFLDFFCPKCGADMRKGGADQ